MTMVNNVKNLLFDNIVDSLRLKNFLTSPIMLNLTFLMFA